jgi:hypothetical protein
MALFVGCVDFGFSLLKFFVRVFIGFGKGNEKFEEPLSCQPGVDGFKRCFSTSRLFLSEESRKGCPCPFRLV